MTPEQQQQFVDAVINLASQTAGTSEYKAHKRNVSGIIYNSGLAEDNAAKALLSENGLEMEEVSKVLPLTFEQEDGVIKASMNASKTYALESTAKAAAALPDRIDEHTTDKLQEILQAKCVSNPELRLAIKTFADFAKQSRTSPINKKSPDRKKFLASAEPIIQALYSDIDTDTAAPYDDMTEANKAHYDYAKKSLRVQYDNNMTPTLLPNGRAVPVVYIAGAFGAGKSTLEERLRDSTPFDDLDIENARNKAFAHGQTPFSFMFPDSWKTSVLMQSVGALLCPKGTPEEQLDAGKEQAFAFARPGPEHVGANQAVSGELKEKIHPNMPLLQGSSLTPVSSNKAGTLRALQTQRENGGVCIIAVAATPDVAVERVRERNETPGVPSVTESQSRDSAVSFILFHREMAEAAGHMVLIPAVETKERQPKAMAATNDNGEFIVKDKEAYSAYVKSVAQSFGDVKLGSDDKQTYADVLVFAFKSEKGTETYTQDALKNWLPDGVKADKELYAKTFVATAKSNGMQDNSSLLGQLSSEMKADKELYANVLVASAKSFGANDNGAVLEQMSGDVIDDKELYANVLVASAKSFGANDNGAVLEQISSDVRTDKEFYANVLVAAFSENGAVDKVGLQTWMNTHRDTSVTKAEGDVWQKADIGFTDRFKAREAQALECCVSDHAL